MLRRGARRARRGRRGGARSRAAAPGRGGRAGRARAGALAPPEERALTVRDVGAGLGAMTWGVARALAAAGARATIRAVWADADERALSVAEELARAAPPGAVDVRPTAAPAARALGGPA